MMFERLTVFLQQEAQMCALLGLNILNLKYVLIKVKFTIESRFILKVYTSKYDLIS